jgi:hypothetical protein
MEANKEMAGKHKGAGEYPVRALLGVSVGLNRTRARASIECRAIPHGTKGIRSSYCVLQAFFNLEF